MRIAVLRIKRKYPPSWQFDVEGDVFGWKVSNVVREGNNVSTKESNTPCGENNEL
jgi:hypothetical protein